VTARRAAPAAALLLVAVVAEARAAEAGPPLALTLAGCERYDEAKLRELVSIEMGTIAARGAAPAGASADVRVACAGDRATIALAPAEGVRATQSELDLSAAAPATRERLLALAITEVVAQGWAPPPAPPPPVAPPPPATLVAQPAPAPSPPVFGVFAGTSARLMASPATWLAGLDVGVVRAVTSWAGVVLDARAEAGEGDTALARVGWRQLTVTGAVALGVTRARWAAHLAPGWTLGYAWLTGRPDAPSSAGAGLGGTWSGPSLTLRARHDLGQRAFVGLEVASGYVTRRLVGLVDGAQPIFEIRGAWALAGLAAGISF
jgi:hypothetical protein